MRLNLFKIFLEFIILTIFFFSLIISVYSGPISGCGFTYNSPGSYYLTNNITYSGINACLEFDSGATGSVLDCKGYSIKGTSNTNQIGIWLVGSDNFVLKNCIIENFYDGIWVSN